MLKTGCKQLSWGVRQVRYTCEYLKIAEAGSDFRDKIAELGALSVLPIKYFLSIAQKPSWCQCSWHATRETQSPFSKSVNCIIHSYHNKHHNHTIPSIVVFDHDRVWRLPLTCTDSVDSIYSYSLTGEDYKLRPRIMLQVPSYLVCTSFYRLVQMQQTD